MKNKNYVFDCHNDFGIYILEKRENEMSSDVSSDSDEDKINSILDNT